MNAKDYLHHFGSCPHCLADPTYVNVKSSHFMLCEAHRVYWPIGDNLFSDWRDESPETWEKNIALLKTLEKVEPRYIEDAQATEQLT